MVQLRKTFFSLGGPTAIEDPRDDLALALGQQLMQRQQMAQANAMDQARLKLAEAGQSYAQLADAEDRALRARQIASQEQGALRAHELDRDRFKAALDNSAFQRQMALDERALERAREQRIGDHDRARIELERARFDRGVTESDREFGLRQGAFDEGKRQFDTTRQDKLEAEQREAWRQYWDNLMRMSGRAGGGAGAGAGTGTSSGSRGGVTPEAREGARLDRTVAEGQIERDVQAQEMIPMVVQEALLTLPVPGEPVQAPDGSTRVPTEYDLVSAIEGYFGRQDVGTDTNPRGWAPNSPDHVAALHEGLSRAIGQRFQQLRQAASGRGLTDANRRMFGILPANSSSPDQVARLNRAELMAHQALERAATAAMERALAFEATLGARLAGAGLDGAPAPAGGAFPMIDPMAYVAGPGGPSAAAPSPAGPSKTKGASGVVGGASMGAPGAPAAGRAADGVDLSARLGRYVGPEEAALRLQYGRFDEVEPPDPAPKHFYGEFVIPTPLPGDPVDPGYPVIPDPSTPNLGTWEARFFAGSGIPGSAPMIDPAPPHGLSYMDPPLMADPDQLRILEEATRFGSNPIDPSWGPHDIAVMRQTMLDDKLAREQQAAQAVAWIRDTLLDDNGGTRGSVRIPQDLPAGIPPELVYRLLETYDFGNQPGPSVGFGDPITGPSLADVRGALVRGFEAWQDREAMDAAREAVPFGQPISRPGLFDDFLRQLGAIDGAPGVGFGGPIPGPDFLDLVGEMLRQGRAESTRRHVEERASEEAQRTADRARMSRRNITSEALPEDRAADVHRILEEQARARGWEVPRRRRRKKKSSKAKAKKEE